MFKELMEKFEDIFQPHDKEEWKKTINRLGRWVDMENDYKTMDLNFMESVWWVFKELWDKDLIYEGYKAMHICPRCETTLSLFCDLLLWCLQDLLRYQHVSLCRGRGSSLWHTGDRKSDNCLKPKDRCPSFKEPSRKSLAYFGALSHLLPLKLLYKHCAT